MQAPPEQPERFTIWHGLLLAETAALATALLMPLTPNKTGSDSSLADLFFEGPTYLQEVLVYFILTNLLILILGVILAVWLRFSK